MPFPGTLRALPGAVGSYALAVEPDHPAFEGHFPGDPILSGLLQVDWAIRLGQESFPIPGAFQALEHLKFQAPIRPSEPVELRLAWDGTQGHLEFQYAGPDGPKSQGIAVFALSP